MAIRLLKAALPCPVMTLEWALELVEYHQRRNEVAKRCHIERWRGEHPGLELNPLLRMTPASEYWQDE